MQRLHCFTKLLFLLALFCGLAVAQTDWATIEGLVRDPSGATPKIGSNLLLLLIDRKLVSVSRTAFRRDGNLL